MIFFQKRIWVYLSLGLTCSSLPFLSKTKLRCETPKYKVEFRGVDSSKELRSLKRSSSLLQYKKKSPKSLAALRYRAEHDIPNLIEVLHAYSYYDACVNTTSYRLPSGKLRMIVAVNKGDPYLLSQFNLTPTRSYQKDEFAFDQVTLSELGIKLDKPAVSTEIVNAEKKLISLLNQSGFPLAELSKPDILVDQAQKTVAVNVKVDEGPIAYFGDVFIQNQGSVRPRFIRNRISWKKGELYNSQKILETEKKLYDSGLFSTVTITHGKSVDSDKQIPLTIELTDSKYNSLTLGGSYTTTWSGLGGGATWQNRNIFRSGINLKLNYEINQKKQNAGLEFLFPDFFSKNQKLVAQSDVLIQNIMPNYEEKGVNTKVYVERRLSRYFRTSLGVLFDQFKTTESLNNGYFSLFGVPYFLNTESSDKVLINPTQGGWGSLNLTPFFSLKKEGGTFTEIKFQGSIYQYIIPSKRIILAMNTVFGSLFGSTILDVPTPYRYFAGSPQHLRGYPYEKISPLNANGTEIGGRSIFLWSIEPRFSILEYFQVVAFFDVGNVYLGAWPKWSDAFAKSVGVGFRYFSFIGPLTLDIGFPLNKRNNIKRRPQFYFSIGQAF